VPEARALSAPSIILPSSLYLLGYLGGNQLSGPKTGNGFHARGVLPAANGRGRMKLLNRAELDTPAARMFDNLVANIEADLGGHDNLSTIERALVLAFAGEALTNQKMTRADLAGEETDLRRRTQAASTMVRVATRLPAKRRAKEVAQVVDHVGEYLSNRKKAGRGAAEEETE
jgi:hypothetical protein